MANSQAISAKVSGEHREYSRFAETVGGDRVRSRLPAAGRSQIRHFLQFRSDRIFSSSGATVLGAPSDIYCRPTVP
jgi:hypothetical protein